MKAKITATENKDQLQENLEKRVQKVEETENGIQVEIDNEEVLERIPGIDKYEIGDQEKPGLKGRPVQELAYAKLESKEDAVKALLATVQGYNLVILETDREWDLRQLRKYNPSIKKLKSKQPSDELNIDKTISNIENKEQINIEIPENPGTEIIYREMLT